MLLPSLHNPPQPQLERQLTSGRFSAQKKKKKFRMVSDRGVKKVEASVTPNKDYSRQIFLHDEQPISCLRQIIDGLFLSMHTLSGSFSYAQPVQLYHGMPLTYTAGLTDLITNRKNGKDLPHTKLP